mmetsp:Transcript_107932/g.336644  ORF Transcript_107932/g.336644 Transcript_107932/m.336644 type:complete len:83 (-) Transcript_107932:2-250(-)
MTSATSSFWAALLGEMASSCWAALLGKMASELLLVDVLWFVEVWQQAESASPIGPGACQRGGGVAPSRARGPPALTPRLGRT